MKFVFLLFACHCAVVCLLCMCRVSIQHVNFHRPFYLKTGEHSSSDDTKAGAVQEDGVKVYPVSSEGGYVIYHVGSSLSKQTLEDLQSYDGFTSGADCVHDETMIKNSVEPSGLDLPPIDTFSSHSSLDTNGKTATMPSVSAFSNGQWHVEDGTAPHVVVDTCSNDSDASSSTESIVAEVINDIIDNVVTQCLNSDDVDKLAGDVLLGFSRQSSNGLDGEDEAHAGGSADNPSDVGSAALHTHSPMSHPLYAHILLYVHKFDTNRAMYALGRLRAILATSPNVIVRALTTSNVGGEQLSTLNLSDHVV